ncbi:hypothetical protein KJ671_03435 [Patescibacteria group bacterium]|nr:hypothetical protein [Patescibacteria group bacterium]
MAVALPQRISAEDIRCPITYDHLVAPYKTNCNHTFSRLPLTSWIHTHSQNPSCPLCRTRITTAQPDNEMARRVDQFVRENHLQDQYRETRESQQEEFAQYVNLPVIPRNPYVPRRPYALRAYHHPHFQFLQQLLHLTIDDNNYATIARQHMSAKNYPEALRSALRIQNIERKNNLLLNITEMAFEDSHLRFALTIYPQITGFWNKFIFLTIISIKSIQKTLSFAIKLLAIYLCIQLSLFLITTGYKFAAIGARFLFRKIFTKV